MHESTPHIVLWACDWSNRQPVGCFVWSIYTSVHMHHFCNISNLDIKHSSNCQPSQCCKAMQGHLPVLVPDFGTPPGDTSWPRYSIHRRKFIHDSMKYFLQISTFLYLLGICMSMIYTWPHATSRYAETFMNGRKYKLAWKLTNSWYASTYCMRASSCVDNPRCSQNPERFSC